MWKADAQAFGSGFAAVVRRADKAEPYFLTAPDKRPLHFSTAEEAELAASRHLIGLWNTEPCYERTKAGARIISIEEKTFGTVTSRKGKAKVERKKRRAMKAAREAARTVVTR